MLPIGILLVGILRISNIIADRYISTSSPRTNVYPSAAVVLLTTHFIFVDYQDKTSALMSFPPQNIITNAPALDTHLED